MSDKKEQLWHNGIAAKPGQFPNPNGIKPGDRVRVIGELPPGRFDWEPLSHEWSDYVLSGNKIDTWAVVERNIGFTTDGILVKLESVNGYGHEVWIHETEWEKLTEAGRKFEQDKKLLEEALSTHCIAQQKTPIYAPTALKELYEANKIQPNSKLVIDGVDLGLVIDCVNENGHIIVNTDTHLVASINISNAYLEAQLHVPAYITKRDGIEPASHKEVNKFVDKHMKLIEQHLGGLVFFGEFNKSADLMQDVGYILSNYMDDHGIESIDQIPSQSVDELSQMVACRLVAYGFEAQKLPRPTIQELDYLQKLGYTEEAMAEKGEILKRWLSDKDLNKAEKVAALSIIENKVLHVVKDIEWGSAKEKHSWLGIPIYKHADTIVNTFMYGGKVTGSHINLATGETEHGKIDIPPCNPDNDYLESFSLMMRNETEMWTNIDATTAYYDFGGFDYQTALIMSQNGGKGQKADSISVEDPEVAQEENTMINHFDLIERS